MITETEMESLPTAFRNIAYIPSEILRSELIRTIVDIHALIKQTEFFQPEPELVTITNRFFSYLTNSCENRSTIVRRGKWMLTQATIVRARLIEFNYRHSVQRIDDYTHVMYADMVDMTATMAQKLSDYVQLNAPDDCHALTDVMEVIVETTATTKSSQSQHYYHTVKTYGDRIIETIDQMIRDKKIGVQSDNNVLVNDLNRFWHRLRSYRNRRVI